MTPEQEKWLAANQKFKRYSRPGLMSLKGWTDIGTLTPDGRFIEGEPRYIYWFGVNNPMASLGDTLYTNPNTLVVVGREFHIC